MRLKNFSLVLTAFTLFAGTGAFAADYYGASNYSGLINGAPVSFGVNNGITPPMVDTNGTSLYTDGRVISQRAIVSQSATLPATGGAVATMGPGRTFFDLQLFGHSLLNFGRPAREAIVPGVQTYAQVIPVAPAATLQLQQTSGCKTISQPAVVEPETKMMKETDTTVKTTKLFRSQQHKAYRVYKKRCAAKHRRTLPEYGS